LGTPRLGNTADFVAGAILLLLASVVAKQGKLESAIGILTKCPNSLQSIWMR